MNTDQVRVRFAPSPTGDFHVGGARTALFNYLFAHHNDGKFILRIEDTDQKRFNPEAMGWLTNGLSYLGLDWDEGPGKGGEFGPYVQSERLNIYNEHIQILLDKGFAYRCFCTPERLEHVREEQKVNKVDIGYDRHCRNLSNDESISRVEAGEAFTVRIKLPLDGNTTVTDAIRGDIVFDYGRLQDSVLIKADGIPTYHFANVVDDHLMKISHIMRGDEWVNSLPLHMYLYQCFGWEPPILAHLPIILNPSGKGKMSKRAQRAPDGSEYPVFVRQFEESGYLPDALVNFMALLGWSFDDKTEEMTRDELVERFSLDRISSSPAAWNYEKLNAMNGDYIRQLSDEELVSRIGPFLTSAGFDYTQDRLLQLIPLVKERMTTLSDSVNQLDIFLVEDLKSYDAALLLPKKTTAEETASLLKAVHPALEISEFTQEKIEEMLRRLVSELDVKAGQLFQPIRVAVCGRKAAPPLFETLEALGKTWSLNRIRNAITLLES